MKVNLIRNFLSVSIVWGICIGAIGCAEADDRYVTLGSHSEMVSALAYSPDGKTIASGDLRGTVKLWDAKKHKHLQTIKTNGKGITALEFSKDSKILAVGCRFKVATEKNTGNIVLYDVATGKEVRRLRGHNGVAAALTFSPDGKLLASAGAKLDDGNHVGVWDYRTGKLLRTVAGNNGPPLQFTASGNYLFAGRFWSTKTWETEGYPQVGMVIDPNPRSLREYRDYVKPTRYRLERKLKNESVVLVLTGSRPGTTYSPDGRLIVKVRGAYISLIHPRTAETISRWNTKSLGRVAISSNSRFAVTPGDRYKVRLWNVDLSIRKATKKSLGEWDANSR